MSKKQQSRQQSPAPQNILAWDLETPQRTPKVQTPITHQRIFGLSQQNTPSQRQQSSKPRYSIFDQQPQEVNARVLRCYKCQMRSSDTFQSSVFHDRALNKEIKIMQTKKRTNSPVAKNPKQYSKRPSFKVDHPRDFLFPQEKENDTSKLRLHKEQTFQPVYREQTAKALRNRDFHQETNVQALQQQQPNIISQVILTPAQLKQKNLMSSEGFVLVPNVTGNLPKRATYDPKWKKQEDLQLSDKQSPEYQKFEEWKNSQRSQQTSKSPHASKSPMPSPSKFSQHRKTDITPVNVKWSNSDSIRLAGDYEFKPPGSPNTKDIYRNFQVMRASESPKAKLRPRNVDVEQYDMQGLKEEFDPQGFKNVCRQKGYHLVYCNNEYDKINNRPNGRGSFMLRGSQEEVYTFTQIPQNSFQVHLDEIKQHLETQGIKVKPKQISVGLQDIVPDQYVRLKQEEAKRLREVSNYEDERHGVREQDVSKKIAAKYGRYVNMEY